MEFILEQKRVNVIRERVQCHFYLPRWDLSFFFLLHFCHIMMISPNPCLSLSCVRVMSRHFLQCSRPLFLEWFLQKSFFSFFKVFHILTRKKKKKNYFPLSKDEWNVPLQPFLSLLLHISRYIVCVFNCVTRDIERFFYGPSKCVRQERENHSKQDFVTRMINRWG